MRNRSQPYPPDTGPICMCCSSPYTGRSFKGLCPECRAGSNDPSQDVVVPEPDDLQAVDRSVFGPDSEEKDHS